MKIRPVEPSSGNPWLVQTIAAQPRWIWGALFIILATAMAYWPVYSAGFIWDDDDYVTQNQTLRSLHGLMQIWLNPAATPQYYPLVHTTFWLEYHLWGLNPMGFHAVNVLFHAAGALLLWRVLAGLQLPGAWLIAAIFALHPVQVESVAWITERKNVLSTLLYFSAALCYLKYSGLDSCSRETSRRGNLYFAALVLFIGALLSKTVACSLPAALLLVHWWKQERLDWRQVRLLVPFFVAGLALGLTTAWLEKHHVGAHGADWSLTFAERGLIAGRAICFYAANLVWPVQLTFIYPRWVISTAVWWQWLFPLLVLGVVTGLWAARHRIGKGPLVAVLFFCGTLFPALGFIDVYPMRFSFVADHFQYLACAGMIALGLGMAAKFFLITQASRRMQAVLAGLLLLFLGGATWHQSHIYQNLEALWRDTLNKNPRSWMAHTNLGRLLATQKKFDEAEAHYKTSLAINPVEASTDYNYANLLARTERFDEAVALYRAAIQLEPEKAEAHNNLGIVLNRQQQTDAAIAEYERAIFYNTNFADAYFNLGNALSAQHKMDIAILAYQQALRLKPDSDVIRKRLQALGATAN